MRVVRASVAIVAMIMLSTACTSQGNGSHEPGTTKPVTKRAPSSEEVEATTGPVTAGPASCPKPTAETSYYELDHFPPEPDQATDAGAYYWVPTKHRCLTTPEYAQLTQPYDTPDACIYLALKKDNPGYDPDATPSAPLKRVQYRIGKGC